MCFCFPETFHFSDNFRGTKFDLPDNIFIRILVFQLAITFFWGTLRNVTSSHKLFPWCASTRMWSFKSLEIVCQKDDALNFQNFTTIENGFQKFQTFPFLTIFYLYGWFKWNCRTTKATPRVLERESLSDAVPIRPQGNGNGELLQNKKVKIEILTPFR